jgi:hypothetical protein
MSNEPNAKVLFRVEYDDTDVADVETLWAYNLGEDNYKLDNLPYFAYGVSWHDIVYAPYDPDEERATFKHVVSKSGNRTIRVIFGTPVEDKNSSQALLDSLAELGCDFEKATKLLVVVNIPPSVELADVAETLTEAEVQWEYADPTYEDLFPDDDEAD